MNRRQFLKLSGLSLFIPMMKFSSKEYPQTVEELKSMMESRHRVGKPTNMAVSVTGEKYLSFYNGVAKIEGESGFPVNSAKKAIKLAWEVFKVYSDNAGKDAILYWRKFPDLRIWTYEETLTFKRFGMTDEEVVKRWREYHKPYYRIYMRLLLSHRKPLDTKSLNLKVQSFYPNMVA